MNPTQTAVISIADIYGSATPKSDPVYIASGPFCIPVTSDTFLSPKGEVCTLEPGDTKPKGPRIILRKKTMKDVYGTSFPAIPEGYETGGEFRPGKKGEIVLGVNIFGENLGSRTTSGDESHPRLILKKKFVEVTPEDAYFGPVPPTPAGYTLGKFVKLADVAEDSVWLSGGGSVMRNVENHEKKQYRYLLHPILAITSKFKIGDRVLVNRRTPALVVDVKANPGYDIFDTKVVFDKGDGSSGWQASKYMVLAPTTNRWLIEVESAEKDIALYYLSRTNLKVISVTPKP
jgi:hypothetical protein